MFEDQLKSLQDLNAQATTAIITYYKGLDDSPEDKLYNIERALANLDILIMYCIQVRNSIQTEIKTLPASSKRAAYDSLEELRIVQDSAKTVSYNLTAVMHSIRDLRKVDLL